MWCFKLLFGGGVEKSVCEREGKTRTECVGDSPSSLDRMDAIENICIASFLIGTSSYRRYVQLLDLHSQS